MAYHIGRILHLHFGYELVDVTIDKVGSPAFIYDTPARSVSVSQMERSITADDLLVVNPSFSHYFFGLRLPGRKIMYVQDFRTYSILDCRFDLYISVSSLVQRFLQAVYGLNTPVIAPFIQLRRLPQPQVWEARPERSAMVYVKSPTPEHKAVLEMLREELRKRDTTLVLHQVVEGRKLNHPDFIRQLGSVRSFVNLSLAEGFGLVPLEAMAMGTMVTGLDGLAGKDFMRNGENCLTGSLTHLSGLPDIVYRALTDEQLAKHCVANAITTAQHYSYDRFKDAWVAALGEFLKEKPTHAG